LRRIFNAELTGRGWTCELELPATDYEILDSLEVIRLKPEEQPKWEICEYYDFEFLAPFLDEDVSFYELNTLCRKLAELDDLQSTAFEGLLQIEINKREGAIGADKLIALASSVDLCHVVGEARNDSQLGRFYAENGFFPELEKVSDEVFELLDFELLGRKARLGEKGVFTRSGYVVSHSGIMDSVDILPLTPQKPGYIFRLVLNNYPFENEENHVWHNIPLELPASESELSAALAKLGNPLWSEVVVGVEDSAIPCLTEGLAADAERGKNIAKLNSLAENIRQMDTAGQLTKYKAALHAIGCSDLDTAKQLVNHLDEYILDTNARSIEDVARNELRTILDDNSAEILLPHINLFTYSHELKKLHNSEMTPYGLVERKDGQPIQKNAPAAKHKAGTADEKMEALLGCNNIINGYVYKNEERSEVCFEGTPENIASFIAQHPDAERILLTDDLDLPVMDTFGWFINTCEDKKLLEKVKEHLVPMQMGTAEPAELFCPTVDEVDAYCEVRQKQGGMQFG